MLLNYSFFKNDEHEHFKTPLYLYLKSGQLIVIVKYLLTSFHIQLVFDTV